MSKAKNIKFDRKVETESGVEYSFTMGSSHYRATYNIEENGAYCYIRLWNAYTSSESMIFTFDEWKEFCDFIQTINREISRRLKGG